MSDNGNENEVPFVYAPLAIELAVQEAFLLRNISVLAKPIMLYEQAEGLTIRMMTQLGRIAPGAIVFKDNMLGYVKELVALDQSVQAGGRVLEGVVTDDTMVRHVRGLSDVVCDMEELRASAGGGTGGVAPGGVVREQDVELKEALLQHTLGGKPSSVKKAQLPALIVNARANGVTLSPSEERRPGIKCLGNAKDAIIPKQPSDPTSARVEISYPACTLARVDLETGALALPKEPTPAAVAFSYETHIKAVLVLACDVPTRAPFSPYGASEVRSYVPAGGHKFLDQASVSMHIEPVQDAVKAGLISAPALTEVLEAMSRTVRSLVAGSGNEYTMRLSAAAALRVTAPDLQRHLAAAACKPRAAAAGAKEEGGAAKRGAEDTPERAKDRAARREAHEANYAYNLANGLGRAGKGKGGNKGANGGKGKGKGVVAPGSNPGICNDFTKGVCWRGAVCKFQHSSYGYPAPPSVPPSGYHPAPWYPQPPPGLPPALMLMPPGAPGPQPPAGPRP
jgi:hypothetical protein